MTSEQALQEVQSTGKIGKVFLDVQFVAYKKSIGLGPNLQSDMAPYTEAGKWPLFVLCEDTQEKRTKWSGKVYSAASKKW